MSWLRTGDTVAFDPRTLHPLEHPSADERTVDEVFGFSVRLAAECASKETDGHASLGMARALAGTPARLTGLMDMLVAAGVWSPADAGGWRLIGDPNYLHLRAQAEIDRDRVRQKDRRDDRLTVFARLRDGDICRYCSNPVNWRDRKSLRGGEYDHVNIANQPTQLHEYVVSCRGCNGDHTNKTDLLPPPTDPKYGQDTREFVRTRLGSFPTKAKILELLNGQRTDMQENATTRQRPTKENATGKPGQRTKVGNAARGQRTSMPENATVQAPPEGNDSSEMAENEAPVPEVAPTETPAQQPDSSDLRQITDQGGDESGSAGSGRDGTSSYGTGHHGKGSPAAGSPPPPAARSKRGRRRKFKPSTSPTPEV